MIFHDDEEKDKEVTGLSDDALEEVLDEEEDDDIISEGDTEEEKDWA